MKSNFLYSCIAASLLLVGCSTKEPFLLDDQANEQTNIIEDSQSGDSFNNLNDVIIKIADQLLLSNTLIDSKTSIILTSFVDLNSLDKTKLFGRIISESMFNELHVRNFKVTDFRGQDAVTVNDDGEFHITRDVEKLKDSIEAIEYILVGTYTEFENESLLLNGRIIDSLSGELISSARVIFKPKDCKYYNICSKEIVTEEIVEKPKPLDIIKDN
ncbi:MAG: FlgO family outer membrane protein [Campylobacterota bacterium]|nr:FlgO family outer membrane protein [Campylobacterota bacterium]